MGAKFTAEGGELKFKAPKPDYENPADANGDNVYEVTVQASDGRLTGALAVKVTVANVRRRRHGDPEQDDAAGRLPGDGQPDRPGRRTYRSSPGSG